MADDLVTLSEVARRVRLSPQRVRQLAARDPAFPERHQYGGYWLVSWASAERYFQQRHPRPGRPPKQR